MNNKSTTKKSLALVKVKKSKTGKGLFAMEKISKGKRIVEYTGYVVKKEDIKKIKSKYLFEIDKKGKTINGNIPKNIARYINHSCRPNCEADGPEGKVYISSIRNIKPGEELTYDYGKEYFDEYIKPYGCRCQKCSQISIQKNKK